MSETLEELTVTWTNDDGVVTTKELDKIVLTKGSWATIMFKYCDLDRKTGEFGKPKIVIRRYQKRSGVYRMQSKFVISSERQANQIVDVIKQWFPGGEETPAEEQN